MIMPPAEIEALMKACQTDPACVYDEPALEHELVVHNVATRLPTADGSFFIHLFTDSHHKEHIALVKGDIYGADNVLTRVHSECMTGDLFGSLRCDCGPQLHHAMRMIEEEDMGIILYLRQEGRGIGLKEKLKTYNLQDQGLDTVDANIELGHRAEERKYDVAARMLEMLGVGSIRLLSNNPDKVKKLEKLGVSITDRVPIEPKVNIENLKYLTTKVEKMGHILDTRELHPFLPEIDDVIRFIRREKEQKQGIPFLTVMNIRTLNGRYPDLERSDAGEREMGIKILKERVANLHDALLLGPEDMETYRGFKDMIGPVRTVLIFDPEGEVNLETSRDVHEELDLKFLHTGKLTSERMTRLEEKGLEAYDISNGKGQLSIDSFLELFPSLKISTMITEGTNEISRFLIQRKLADILVQVVLPSFDGKELRCLDSGPELNSPRSVLMGDTTVYFSSQDQ
jgi:3,4-dihydroxy 2-butanone 4-phosphate synthase/GTP cyclohydrolase II